ncbi:uncharacterized protein LOC104898905 isoform X2 [Beta vulgaris subsp. vulgaris]|uniref:uncharacterized protein LOC104898905 isoform X2 n=1 Tax=Beta vulgaris subsp. vulgaris TaxID=3555 RepID=UPI00053FA9DD|nr:uncharacterized protein LOC104898905 isoform X2 [Beta vulgaris subsp. vulgaris]
MGLLYFTRNPNSSFFTLRFSKTATTTLPIFVANNHSPKSSISSSISSSSPKTMDFGTDARHPPPAIFVDKRTRVARHPPLAVFVVMVESLTSKIWAWEKERGVELFYDGVSLLSLLEDYNILREEKEKERQRQRDQKKLQGRLLAEQEALFGSTPSPT